MICRRVRRSTLCIYTARRDRPLSTRANERPRFLRTGRAGLAYTARPRPGLPERTRFPAPPIWRFPPNLAADRVAKLGGKSGPIWQPRLQPIGAKRFFCAIQIPKPIDRAGGVMLVRGASSARTDNTHTGWMDGGAPVEKYEVYPTGGTTGVRFRVTLGPCWLYLFLECVS